MKIPLPTLASQKGIRRKTVALPIITPTRVLENDLFAIYADSLRIWAECAQKLVAGYTPSPITTDADGTALQWLIDQAAHQAENTILYQTEKLGRWTARVGTWHGAKTISGVKSALGIEIAPYVRLGDVSDLLQDAVRQNVSLIRGVNSDNRKAIEQAIYNALTTRKTKKELTDTLSGILNTSKARARRIAGDQTHKLNVALTGYRNEQLGISSYVWVTRHDDRVRPAHRARDGKVFEWAKPPYDGPPGYPVGCRCAARGQVELDGN